MNHNNKKDRAYVAANFSDALRNEVIDHLKNGCDGLEIFKLAESMRMSVNDVSAIFRAGRPGKIFPGTIFEGGKASSLSREELDNLYNSL